MSALKDPVALLIRVLIMTSGLLAACAGGGSPRISYSVGVGYGGYYGPGPWGAYPGRPIYIGGGRPDIPDIPDRPIAAPLPDFGMPDAGIGTMDMGGFDF
jgi:hypothetical protein